MRDNNVLGERGGGFAGRERVYFLGNLERERETKSWPI